MTAWSLSQREKEILRKLAQGKASKQIADDVCLSYNTIRNMCYRARKKMGAVTVTQAVVMLALWDKENL